MTAPVVKVELGFGATWQTTPASITWTDVTGYVLQAAGVSTMRGASSARGEVDVGSMGLSFDNSDRRFDPTYTAGPYYANLKSGVPVRVTATPAGGASKSVGYGTVARWPQRYDIGNRFSWVPVDGYDGFDKLARARIPRSVLEVEVLVDTPAAYWQVDESDTTQPMADSSGNRRDGVYTGTCILGSDPLVVDSGTAFTAGLNDSARGVHTGDAFGQALPISMSGWVKFPRDAGNTHVLVAGFQKNSQQNTRFAWLGVASSAGGSPNGEIFFHIQSGLGSILKVRGSTRVDDDAVHHLCVTMSANTLAGIKLYVDGVEETQTVVTNSGAWIWPSGLRYWSVANFPDDGAGDCGIGGVADDVAVFASALSAARVLAHYNAGAAPLDDQTTDQRIGWILDELDWPTLLRSLETGNTKLGPATFKPGDTALEYLRLVARSEDSRLFMTPDGKVRFLNRYWRYTNTLATAVQFTFTDADTTKGYAEFELDLDDDLVVNVARFTRRGGVEQVESNATSVATYGEAEKQQTDLLQRTDVEVRSLAEWTVATQGTPLPRVPKIRVPLHAYSAADQATVLGLDLGHRVRVVRTPQGVGTAISLDFHIDGISNTTGEGVWWWEAYVSPVPERTVGLLLWDTDNWDDTDAVWAF